MTLSPVNHYYRQYITQTHLVVITTIMSSHALHQKVLTNSTALFWKQHDYRTAACLQGKVRTQYFDRNITKINRMHLRKPI